MGTCMTLHRLKRKSEGTRHLLETTIPMRMRRPFLIIFALAAVVSVTLLSDTGAGKAMQSKSAAAESARGNSYASVIHTGPSPGTADSRGDVRQLTLDIPERSWNRPSTGGKELTPDIAEKYPRTFIAERTISNNAFAIGEHLVFQIQYGFYEAGTATMSIEDEEYINGGLCYRIVTTANSNNFISKFYKVRDRVASYLDKEGLFSRRFEKHLREGDHDSDRIVDFYHERLIALSTTKKYAVTEIQPYVNDVLSALYYVRTRELEVGKDVVFDIYADGKIYPLRVIVRGRETVKVPAGEFSCLKIEPVMRGEGIFQQKGKLMVWLTDDEKKIPVKMTSKIAIGSIGSELASYRLGTYR